MINKETKNSILMRYSDVAPYLEAVREAADGERDALGFLPTNVYFEFARKEQLLVAVCSYEGRECYGGHLLFDARHPKARVLQMYVAPSFRKNGLATLLLDCLKTHLTDHAFISIYARVAQDLSGANDFWQRQGFYVQSVVPGGQKRKRTIFVRTHELDTPQLFAASGVTAMNPLGLDVVGPADVPLFLLDLNVLFDLDPRRRKSNEVLELFRAERLGTCRLALSEEISAELIRTASTDRPDPMQAYARIFPTFTCPSADESHSLSAELASIVFPDRHHIEGLAESEVSDLRHLATVIHHKLAGLVTNDSSILRTSRALKQQYGIEVISPAVFQSVTSLGATGERYETTLSETLSLTPVAAGDEAAVRQLLSKVGVSSSKAISDWAASDAGGGVCVRCGAWSDGKLVGYFVWLSGVPRTSLTARIVVDESHPNAMNAARALLNQVLEQALATGTAQIRLEFPRHQAAVREVALAHGFGGVPDQASLQKIVLGRVVTNRNWDEYRGDLVAVGRLKLPDVPPTFSNADQQIKVLRPDGNAAHVSLTSLETLLAPALFCLSMRPAVITPVRRDFAEHLLAHLPQRSLLPHARAALYREKHYLSDKRTLKHFQRGSLVLFYESTKNHGLGAIVAIARVQHAYLKSQEAMARADLDPSVLDDAALEAIGRSKVKTVTVFDNLIQLPHPVPLETLRLLGCGDATKLMTTHPINDSQLQEIVARGFADE
ncbi:GNAT family N-acetyltransferase [Burkholderia ubonensis]|uniref:GNAT family N-acetyltransferase n=1 Tax=Burkholderia ubonensis TaxID=101571 RepID=UPI0005DA0A5E|nr:GNAT family N-acetyltransferase [Burkholderia ubonensis]AJX16187.1 acetyltransferase family protein [Burkholderia ubonensis MSMB22]